MDRRRNQEKGKWHHKEKSALILGAYKQHSCYRYHYRQEERDYRCEGGHENGHGAGLRVHLAKGYSALGLRRQNRNLLKRAEKRPSLFAVSKEKRMDG